MKLNTVFRAGFLVIISILGSIYSEAVGQTPIKILPLGNSLTVGETGEPNPDLQLPPEQLIGYRYGLKYLLQQGGYNVDFVGSESNGSAYFSDCQHAGIGGSRDQYVERLLIDGYDLRNGVQILVPPRNYLDEYQPDMILLHIGTNDVTHEADLITNQRVSAILDLIDQYELRSGKTVTVFLALIINRRLPCVAGSGCQTTIDWNNYIRTMAQNRINNGDNIVIVDMEHDAGIVYTNEDFTASDPQGIHLNSNGYGKMAALWYTSIVNHYNNSPVISPIPDQIVSQGHTFNAIRLDDYVYDVEDSDAELIWTITHVSTNHLSVQIDANRIATVSAIDPYWSGEEKLVFTVTDKGVNGTMQRSVSDTVTFTILDTYDPPTIIGQSDLSVLEDGNLELTLSDFEIINPDGDGLPENLELNVLSGQHYTFSGKTIYPDPDFDNDINVNVSVSDQIGPGPVYQALVDVIPVNDPPVYLGQNTIRFDEDKTYTVNFSDIQVEDVDNVNSELQIIMQPGTYYDIDGATIIPHPDFNGALYIETFIEDPDNERSNTFNLSVFVDPVNDPPQFTTEPEDTAYADQSYVYPFNAEDKDGQALTYSIVKIPDWITYYPNSKLLAGIPSSSDVGYTQIKIRASDGTISVEQSYYLHVMVWTSLENQPLDFNEPSVFPNPADGYVVVKYEGQGQTGSFKLMDSKGKIMMTESLIAGSNTIMIPTSGIPTGLYVYTISNGVEQFTGKLIIKGK